MVPSAPALHVIQILFAALVGGRVASPTTTPALQSLRHPMMALKCTYELKLMKNIRTEESLA